MQLGSLRTHSLAIQLRSLQSSPKSPAMQLRSLAARRIAGTGSHGEPSTLVQWVEQDTLGPVSMLSWTSEGLGDTVRNEDREGDA